MLQLLWQYLSENPEQTNKKKRNQVKVNMTAFMDIQFPLPRSSRIENLEIDVKQILLGSLIWDD